MTAGPAGHAQRRRPDRAALVIAAGLFLLGVVVAWDAMRLGAVASYARIGPQTIPYVVAACLAGLAAWTVIEALRGDFPAREPQEVPPILWIVGGLLVQLLLVRLIGFSVATGLMFGCVARGFGERRLWLAWPVGILLSAAVWLLFVRGLALSLPAGPPEEALGDGLDAVLNLFRPPAGAAP